jgi:heterodisulfide reductase subunit A-like polyferredoxin
MIVALAEGTYGRKEAIVAKENSKNSLDTAIFYRDMRRYGKDFERYYNRAKEAGVRLIKSKISHFLPKDDSRNQRIRYTDLAGRRVEEAFATAVLSVSFSTRKHFSCLSHFYAPANKIVVDSELQTMRI